MTKPQQDDLSRQRRLNRGLCPSHGVTLTVIEYTLEGHPVVACPREHCDFMRAAKPGTKLFKVVCESEF